MSMKPARKVRYKSPDYQYVLAIPSQVKVEFARGFNCKLMEFCQNIWLD